MRGIDKFNKFNILVAISMLLAVAVIGQFVYIAKIYPKESGWSQKQDEVVNTVKLNDIFDDLDKDYMSNHLKEFKKMQEHMSNFFENVFSDFKMQGGSIMNDPDNLFDKSKISSNLGFDLKNERDKFILTLDLQDTDKNNVDVKLENQKLTISGNVIKQLEETNNISKRYKQYISKFNRSIVLPEKVKNDSLNTKFEKNKLIITILKDIKEGST